MTAFRPPAGKPQALPTRPDATGKRRIKLLIILLTLLGWAAPVILIKLYPEQIVAWFISLLPLVR